MSQFSGNQRNQDGMNKGVTEQLKDKAQDAWETAKDKVANSNIPGKSSTDFQSNYGKDTGREFEGTSYN